MSSQYGELPRLAAAIVLLVCGTPANFNGLHVLASLLQRRRSTEANKTKMFGRFLGWYTIYTFSGAVAPQRNFARCKIYFASQVSRSPILPPYTALEQRPSGKRYFIMWYVHRTRNKITELSLRAPPIFAFAAITLGIGPHSSVISFTVNGVNCVFGRPFVKRFALCYRSVVCLSCLSCL